MLGDPPFDAAVCFDCDLLTFMATRSLKRGQNHEQDSGESELTKNAFKILYATDDDQGQHHAEDEAGGLGREVLDGDVAQVG